MKEDFIEDSYYSSFDDRLVLVCVGGFLCPTDNALPDEDEVREWRG
jgi:hypothetical protein